MERICDYFRDWRSRETVFWITATTVLILYTFRVCLLDPTERLAELIDPADTALVRALHPIVCAVLWLFLVPVLLIRWGWKRPLLDFGIWTGDIRFGSRFLLFWPLVLPVLVVAASQGPFQAVYPLWKGAGKDLPQFLTWELLALVHYLAWEFFFRGFLLFGLMPVIGPMRAIWVQTMASTLILVDRPAAVMAAAVPAGLVFGSVALRTGSILYPLVFHWGTGVATDGLCALLK